VRRAGTHVEGCVPIVEVANVDVDLDPEPVEEPPAAHRPPIVPSRRVADRYGEIAHLLLMRRRVSPHSSATLLLEGGP
jgi:hypothetical protein